MNMEKRSPMSLGEVSPTSLQSFSNGLFLCKLHLEVLITSQSFHDFRLHPPPFHRGDLFRLWYTSRSSTFPIPSKSLGIM